MADPYTAGKLQIVEHKKATDIIDAIAEPVAVTTTIDGASTIEIFCADPHRKLLRNKDVSTRATCVVNNISYELVALAKTGSRYKLTFEDLVVAELRRQTKHLVVKGGTTSRGDFARRLANEADVKIAVDPGHQQKVRTPFERSAGGTKSDSWDILGSDVAEPIRWRRFSDGTQLVIGGDEWLMGRFKATALKEHTAAVDDIDFDLDQGKRASRATLAVTADAWAVPIGSAVLLEDMGPADGRWLVAEFTRTLTSVRGTVTLTRARHVLPEPKKKTKKKDEGTKK